MLISNQEVVRKVTGDDIPPWYANRPLYLMLYKLQIQPYALALVVFVIYLCIPFVFSIYDGTVLSSSRAGALAEFARNMPASTIVTNLTHNFVANQKLREPNSVAYLQDTTHFIFSVIFACGSVFGTYTLMNLDRTVLRLLNDGIPKSNSKFVIYMYKYYRNEAFMKKYIIICGAFGFLAFCLFMYLNLSSEYQFWWGSIRYGITGVVFAMSAGFMVFALLLGGLLLIFGSIMLTRLVKFLTSLRPFHRDGCNGLSPMGRQIFMLWCVALFGGMAIYVALRVGYLGIEHTPIVWLFVILGTITIPVIAIIPLLASLQTIKRVQNTNLERLGAVLNQALNEAASAIQKQDFVESNKAITRLNELKGLFEIIKATNVWPFNPKALTFIVVANGIQIALTFKELLNLVSTG